MRSLIFCTLAVLLMVACRKEEFQQPPHGESVPYDDTARLKVTDLLANSPYKLFYTAWKESNMDTFMSKQFSNLRYTMLVPDDAAMTAAGYTSDVIASTDPKLLDTLIRFHIVTAYVDSSVIRTQAGSVRYKSLLQDAVLVEQLNATESNVTYPKPYTYKQFLALAADGALLVNGKNVGKGTRLFATNGIIWPVNQVLQRPTETVMDMMRRDPRFSIFVELEHQVDSIWKEVSMELFERIGFRSLQLMNGNSIESGGFFAPTNEAFKKAGFNSVEDLMALNARSMPYMDWDYFEIRNGFVTDSLLNYHIWGRMYAPTGPWGSGYASPAMFWSNDLDNNIIGNYLLNGGALGSVPSYYMSLDFGTNGAGQQTVKVKGSTRPAATIGEADLNTFQGPVHAMDNLILSDKVQF